MNAILVSKGDDTRARSATAASRWTGWTWPTFLKLRKVERLFVAGLATEYCVRQTALDACAAGFKVYLVEDAVRGISPKAPRVPSRRWRRPVSSRVVSDRLEDSGERPAAAYDEERRAGGTHD